MGSQGYCTSEISLVSNRHFAGQEKGGGGALMQGGGGRVLENCVPLLMGEAPGGGESGTAVAPL